LRNAILLLTYKDIRFLIDPFLADQGTYPAFSGTEDSHLRKPLVPLVTGRRPGSVCGVAFQTEGDRTLYLAGEYGVERWSFGQPCTRWSACR